MKMTSVYRDIAQNISLGIVAAAMVVLLAVLLLSNVWWYVQPCSGTVCQMAQRAQRFHANISMLTCRCLAGNILPG